MRLLLLGLAPLLACGASGSSDQFFPGSTPVPTTGPEVPGVADWDRTVISFMRRWNAPGATLAAAARGQLLVARGYGYADVEAGALMDPATLVRVASISKSFTSTALLRLADEGHVALDAPLSDFIPLPDGADPELTHATLRHLLAHEGGWDRAESGDPIAHLDAVAKTLGVPGPVSAADLAGYALSLPLDFAPGTRFAYSNLGYVVLGRVIERVTGQPYEAQVRESVCAPAGITDMRVGGTRAADRVPGEARYYDPPGAPLVPSVFPGEGRVARPYGWTDLAAIDAAGGWLASAVDLTRFMTALDGSRGAALLSPEAMAEMTARPPLPDWEGAPSWFGLGMQVQPTERGAIWHHGGSTPGASGELLRAPDGWTVAVLFNTRPADEVVDRFEQDLLDTVWSLASARVAVSAEDLYPLFP